MQNKIKSSTVVQYIVLFSEKFAEYDHPIECSSEQLQLLGIQWLAHQKCIKEINRAEQIFC